MYDPAHMSVLLFHLYIYYFNPCVCVSTHVCAPASSSIFVHIYSHICIVCVMLSTYSHVFVCLLLSPKLNRHLCHGVYWCDHTSPHIITLWFLLYFHFVNCTSTIVQSLTYLSPPDKKTLQWHGCVNTYKLNRDLTAIKIIDNSDAHF